jgi:hypothetical protein
MVMLEPSSKICCRLIELNELICLKHRTGPDIVNSMQC